MEGSRSLVLGVLDGRGLDLPDLCLAAEKVLGAGADMVDLVSVSEAERAHVAHALGAERIVTDPRQLEGAVTTSAIPELAVAVVRGCRVIRTSNVRSARRVVDVLAAVAGCVPERNGGCVTERDDGSR